ncbi:universal stress protein [Lysinibacillus irui]|uniref:Universal stress protein n=1 Tax=Lysinibacillus irui TaxID=2998077 RepID=A0AAJ5UYE4_9BACI|nr:MULTISPECIES: universal stress protein [Lysinibacillus]MEA0553219.1 universal stress protein [Lysinibacillus irui]MEA0562518.1 universal stress protein [Lysinibacillus irui]MEA0979021.1 universal stress protein [Lysinibacillus irui]MEA1045175.1 universal stress protein [Lysinibacillus irui]WDV08890.1 universal stress protein [Lysinibacillus irui]
MYQRILLTVDGSDNAFRAAQEAIKLAKLSETSTIDIVYVVNVDKIKNELLIAGTIDNVELARQRKIAPVEQALQEANISYQTTFLKGDSGPEIVRYANEQQVDLVVIGSRGLNSLQEMVLGSVSHKVMKRVQCPALIVK